MLVGLDTAANRWHAVTDDGVGFCSELKGVAWKDPDKRRAQLADTFGSWLLSLPEKPQVYAEEPLALQNGKTTRLLGLAAGALWQAGRDVGVEWHWVDVAMWKRVIVGNGNADKEEIRLYVIGGPRGQTDPVYEAELDLYDSRCLLDFGHLCNISGRVPADFALPKKPKRAKKKANPTPEDS